MKIPLTDYLRIKVIPKSSKNEVTEILDDDTIKIRIKAVPEKGKANEELIKFLSKELNIEKSRIKILSGKTEQLKLIKIDGLNK
ncbi:hypothetical protein COU74_01630 [Candidatus Peregrinibacteria bacterium CG10_big_fil_rev_8_21_14_0_10_36_19]|nr:MAG: hypothetical protein COU74_01630 [Candidatus Peregrinibacteria bacterium CG10_big_fil_rev_8_21_14_0_10_36_19]